MEPTSIQESAPALFVPTRTAHVRYVCLLTCMPFLWSLFSERIIRDHVSGQPSQATLSTPASSRLVIRESYRVPSNQSADIAKPPPPCTLSHGVSLPIHMRQPQIKMLSTPEIPYNYMPYTSSFPCSKRYRARIEFSCVLRRKVHLWELLINFPSFVLIPLLLP